MDTNTSHILPFKNSITVLLHIMALDCIREYVNEKSVCINSIDLVYIPNTNSEEFGVVNGS